MISATAFHCINSEIGYPKVHKLLKANGSIAVFWNMASVTHHNNYAFEKVREVYREYAPELGDGKTKEELEQIHELRLKELLGQGLFTELVYKSYVKEVEYTPEKYVQLLNTYSNHRMLSEEKRTIFFEKIKETIYNSGGKIIIPNETKLYFAKKIV